MQVVPPHGLGTWVAQREGKGHQRVRHAGECLAPPYRLCHDGPEAKLVARRPPKLHIEVSFLGMHGAGKRAAVSGGACLQPETQGTSEQWEMFCLVVLEENCKLDPIMKPLEQLMELLLLNRKPRPFHYLHGPLHIFKLLVFQSNGLGSEAGRQSCFSGLTSTVTAFRIIIP